MQVVREISTQTAEGSTATSTSIAKLAALSAQLRKSVAGFRLPDYAGRTTTVGSTSSRLPALKPPANGGAAVSPAGATSGTSSTGGSSSSSTGSSTSNTGNSGKMRKASGFGA
jgi:hypothetical protein